MVVMMKVLGLGLQYMGKDENKYAGQDARARTRMMIHWQGQ